MTVFIAGASGATGKLLVAQLLKQGIAVKALVRAPDTLTDTLGYHPLLTVIQANILDLSAEELRRHINGCTAIACCLGHNLTFKGMFGAPRRLVTEATRRLCDAIIANQPTQPVKFVLMNTAGNRNRGLNEPLSLAERCVISLIRLLLPPHADNEQAADYLRTHFPATTNAIEWSVIRPDTLLNENSVSDYEIFPSPTRSALFNAGQTSRINVAHFMALLLTDNNSWQDWRGQMPVIYNKGLS